MCGRVDVTRTTSGCDGCSRARFYTFKLPDHHTSTRRPRITHMPYLLAIAVLVAGCASAPQEPPDPLLEKLKAGEAPEELTDATHPALVDEADRALREGRAWKSADDRARAVRFFLKRATRKHTDGLFLLFEKGAPPDALGAVFALAAMLEEGDLPRVEGYLTGADRAAAIRAFLLLGEARLGAALVEKHAPSFLKAREQPRPVLHAIGVLRARGATTAVLDYFGETDDAAALRCLGRIWEQRIGARAPAKDDERTRLTVLLLLHRLTMTIAPSPESAEAMLRVMTEKELTDFLAKFAAEKFAGRGIVSDVAGDPKFDRAKGARVHSALITGPDHDLAARILWTTPHSLDETALVALLESIDPIADPDLPKETLLRDYAALRLAWQRGRKVDLPPSAEERAKFVEVMRKESRK